MKVAVYCRVSTDRQDQANSFESQQRYFREYINEHPGWELYRIYADEGVTGTSTQKRAAFNCMIRDARLKRFELILTKEVSRFSRNILDTISYTRDLRRLGIGVQFVNDGINSLEPDSELRLSIMGSIAQEESRRTSSRVKWGQARRMEQGVVFGRSLLGYDVRNGKMSVNPEGAETVRMIFHKYVYERKGTTVIARELQQAGRKTLSGAADWRNTAILKILRNEKYCGDLKQKKTITPDYLSHRKQYNHGEEAFICLRDHHEAIVDRKLWEEAQREIARRNISKKDSNAPHGHRYPLSGKIRCGECGRGFVCRNRKRRDGSSYRIWRCGTAAAKGKHPSGAAGSGTGCAVGCQLRDQMGMEMVRQAVKTLKFEEALAGDIVRIVLNAIQSVESCGRSDAASLREEQKRILERKEALLDTFLMKCISREDMCFMNAEYDGRMAALTEKLAAAEEREKELAAVKMRLRAQVEGILSGETASDHFYSGLLDSITVYQNRQMEIRLKLLPARWTFAPEQPACAKDQATQHGP